MRRRDKIKSLARKLFGRDKPVTQPPSNTSVHLTESQDMQVSAPVSKPEPKPVIQPESVAAPEPSTSPSTKPTVSSSADPVSQDKIERHRKRTRQGLLKKTIEAGGTIGLAVLHDHSEKRFFVGHKAFSDMLEQMVEDELFLFDWDTQEATITDKGRDYVQ